MYRLTCINMYLIFIFPLDSTLYGGKSVCIVHHPPSTVPSTEGAQYINFCSVYFLINKQQDPSPLSKEILPLLTSHDHPKVLSCISLKLLCYPSYLLNLTSGSIYTHGNFHIHKNKQKTESCERKEGMNWSGFLLRQTSDKHGKGNVQSFNF